MFSAQHTARLLPVLIALVWMVNGLFCKVLGMVPRHEAIVAAILGAAWAPLLTTAIGLAETGMSFWILSGLWPKLCGALQLVLIVLMNVLEALLAPGLLLFGYGNLILAALLLAVIWLLYFGPLSRALQAARP